MFTLVEPPHPAAALLSTNDPIRHKEAITDLGNRGFMGRTRAVADTIEARKKLTDRKIEAIESVARGEQPRVWA